MAYNYARAKATADRLLGTTKFGKTATLRRPTSSGTAYNPTSGTPDDYDVTVVVSRFTRQEIDGTRILATDKKFLMAKGDLTIEPTTSDKLVLDGLSYSIIDVRPLEAGSPEILMYTIQARR